MKKLIIVFITLGIILALSANFSSCAIHPSIHLKSGAQLWGENCVRCHNVPPPDDFSDSQWVLIGNHMRMRANLTAEESNKIIEFLNTIN